MSEETFPARCTGSLIRAEVSREKKMQTQVRYYISNKCHTFIVKSREEKNREEREIIQRRDNINSISKQIYGFSTKLSTNIS